MIAGSVRQPSGLGTVDADNPWPGLAAFREADQPFFQGRTTVIEELTRMVLRARLTVLHGVSGLGKTSVLRAGLFPRVRPEYLLPIYVRLSHAEESAPLTDQVREAIEAAASAAGVEAPSAAADRTLWEYFHRKDAHFWDARNRIVTPLLVIDQFEELFTVGRATAERRARTDAFLTELSDLVEGRPSPGVRARLEQDPEEALGFSMTDQPCKVLISLREDFLPDLADLRGRMPTLTDTMFRLQPMTAAEALSVVEVGGSDLVDSHVAEQIVQWVASDTGDKSDGRTAVVEPALLSVFCRELNNKRQAQGAKAITADLLETKRESIISDFYERTIKEGGLSPAVRAFVEERLLTESGFRDSVAEEQALRTPGISQQDVETLISRRLLRREDGGTKGRSRLEITHDVLAEAVRTSRDRRRLREKEERALAERRVIEERTRREAEEAANRERQRRDVEAARALAETQSKAAELAKALALEEQRGREAAEQLTRLERRARKRQIALLSVVVLATTALAWVARQSAERTRRQLSIADVDRAVAGEPLTLAYLARAVENDPDSVMARALLLGHLSQQVMEVAEMTQDRTVTSAVLNADSTRILTVSGQGIVRIWAAPAGTPVGAALVQDEDVAASAAFSGDGKRVLTATRNGVVRVWDAATAAPIGEPLRHDAVVNMASFDQAGERVVTASDDHRVRVWNPKTGEQIVFLAADDPIVSASFQPGSTGVLSISQSGETAVWEPKPGTTTPQAKRTRPRSTTGVVQAWFSRDGQRTIAVLADGSVRVTDTRSGRAAGPELPSEGPIVLSWFDPVGERLITTANSVRGDGTVVARVWNARTGARLPSPLSHRGAITMAAFSHDGSRLVTASEDRTAQVWDVANGVAIGPPLHHDGPVVWAGFSPDGARVVTASKDQTAQIWDAASGTQIGAPLRHDGPVLSAVFSADGVSVVTASSDKTARQWDTRTGSAIGRRLRPADRMTITLATFSPDGVYVATAERLDPNLPGQQRAGAGEGWVVRLADAASGQSIGLPMTHTATVNSIEFSSAGPARVVTASEDGTARLWDARAGSPIGAVMRHGASVLSAAFSRDGTLVVTASADKTARVWDAGTGQPVTAPLMHPDIVHSATFSPDGSRLVTGCEDKRARTWNARTGAAIATSDLHMQSVEAVRFSRSGDRILSSSYEDSMIWDAQSHNTVGHLDYPTTSRTPVLSPDGTTLIVISPTDAASVWDVKGEPEWRGYLGDDPVAAVAFSGGDLVVTFSVDGTAQFWNLRTRKRVGLTVHNPSPVRSAVASVQGSRLLAIGDNGIVSVWDVPVGSPDDWQPLVDMAVAVGGHEVESANVPGHINRQTDKLTAQRALARNGPAEGATAAAFRRWLFADPATRTISPLSRITVPEYIKRLLAEGESGRREVERLFPGYRGLPLGNGAAGPDPVRAPAR